MAKLLPGGSIIIDGAAVTYMSAAGVTYSRQRFPSGYGLGRAWYCAISRARLPIACWSAAFPNSLILPLRSRRPPLGFSSGRNPKSGGNFRHTLAPARYHRVITGRADNKANPATAIGTRFGTESEILKILSWMRGVACPAAIIALGLALAGCQAIPGSGPEMLGAARGTTEALPFDVLDLTAVSVVPYRPVAGI